MTIGLPMVRRTRRVLVAAAVVSATALGGIAVTTEAQPIATAAATRAQCTHNTNPGALESDGIKTWNYRFIRSYSSPGGAQHLHDFYQRVKVGSNPWSAFTRRNGVVCTGM